jgi:hypothetical protein
MCIVDEPSEVSELPLADFAEAIPPDVRRIASRCDGGDGIVPCCEGSGVGEIGERAIEEVVSGRELENLRKWGVARADDGHGGGCEGTVGVGSGEVTLAAERLEVLEDVRESPGVMSAHSACFGRSQTHSTPLLLMSTNKYRVWPLDASKTPL